MKHHPIFQNTITWKKELINRTVVAPMSRVSATAEGLATDEMKDYYFAFAIGGFAVIITEGIYTDAYGSQSYNNQPALVTHAQSNSWEKVTRAVHQSPALIFAQLMHAGALSQYSDDTLGIPVIANGGFHNLDKAEVALKNGHATLIAIGKAALADPHWVMKTMNGLPLIPFHREMLWPEATLNHTRKIVKELNLEHS